ncbi:MAG: hypothetical protein ACJZ4D_01530 [Candidatus Poseidoniales archaeon]
MGRKKIGVGSFSVTVPLTELKQIQKHMKKENISRSRLVTLSLQSFLYSKTRINDYITQNENFSNKIKELKEQSKHYEKETERFSHNLKVQSISLNTAEQKLKGIKKEFILERKKFNSKQKKLEKEIKKLNRKLVLIDEIIKK